MKNLKRIIAGLIAVTSMMSVAVSCGDKSEGSSGGSGTQEATESNEHYKEEDDVAIDVDEESLDEYNEGGADISGTTITWLADYDINPQNNNDRSVALSLFEDVYGGKINFVQTTSDDKFSKLATMILSGDEVDMFPYEWDAVPNGVMKNQYEPLDPYFDSLGMDTGLWDDMEDVIDMFEYKGEHYVVPYTISDPLLITYSRKMMQENGLDDPYELYQDGEWDWDAFMDMMEQFVANAGGSTRYGINGWFGQAVIQSTGHTVINYEDGKFINNIDDPEIEKAELLLQEIATKHLYYPEWIGYFPADQSTLFFAMADWALGASNAKNDDDMDLMIVPFPKAPDADENYLCCNFGAKMLIKNSTKGDAVATYLKCERLAATQDEYKEAAKQKALIVEQTAAGIVKSYITEEQYDALQEYKDPDNVTPMFDFGYGMGDRMYGDGEYTYETRGVMNNLEETLLEGNSAVDSWATLRDTWTGVISEEVDRFNK